MKKNLQDRHVERSEAKSRHLPTVGRCPGKPGMTLVAVAVLLCFAATGAFAQTSVNVRPITVNYSAAPPTVTFEVSWAAGTRDANHRSKVWMVVDYRRVQNFVYIGDWLRAGVTGTPAVTASAGTVSYEPGNTKGFWLQGTDGAFAATVTVSVTVDLDGYDNKFGWCGDAIDRPPYAEEKSAYYALYGAPPFIIQTHPTNPGNTVTHSTATYSDCMYGLTDATGAPGDVPPMPSVTNFTASTTAICEGQSVTLTATATNAGLYSFDNGATWDSNSSTVVSPTATTTYTLKVSRAAGGCTATYGTPIEITVHPLPAPAFVSPPAGLCANSDATLTVTDPNNAAASYCFTYECTDCTHKPYVTSNGEAAAAGCYWYSECVYGEANTYTVSMPDAGTLTVWAKAITPYGCVDSVATTIADALPPAIIPLRLPPRPLTRR
jgi:hypothetical protein